jgi:hypothetical protein
VCADVTIYKVHVERERWQTLSLAEPDELARRFPRPFCGFQMRPDGKPIVCTIDDGSKLRADFSYLLPGTFVVRHRGSSKTNVLSQVLWEDGDMLPIQLGDEVCHAFNARVVNALDLPNCEIQRLPDGKLRVLRYAFHSERLRENVFKIPETADTEIYTFATPESEALSANELIDDEFLRGYLQEGWTGLMFEKVWSSATRS